MQQEYYDPEFEPKKSCKSNKYKEHNYDDYEYQKKVKQDRRQKKLNRIRDKYQ